MIFLVTPRAQEDADRQRVIVASSPEEAARTYFSDCNAEGERRLSVREIKPYFFRFIVRETTTFTVEEEKG